MTSPSGSAGPASTTSRTWTATCPATASSSSPGPRVPGKSSLAFDTLYAEGQRRYVESLSAYARQFLEQMEKPDVDAVTGLSPAIAIDQRTTVSHPRSTVGTVSEIYDYLRVLFAAVGRPHCPRCAEPISSQTAAEIAELLLRQPGGHARRPPGPGGPRPQGRLQDRAPGRRGPGPEARPDRREAVRPGAPARPRPAPQPQDRRARGPADPASRGRGPPARRARAGLRPRPRRRAPLLRRRQGAPLQPQPGLRALRRLAAGDEPPRLLLQQRLRGLPRVRRAGGEVVGGPRAGGAGRVEEPPGRRHPPLPAPRAAPAARGPRGPRRPPRLLPRDAVREPPPQGQGAPPPRRRERLRGGGALRGTPGPRARGGGTPRGVGRRRRRGLRGPEALPRAQVLPVLQGRPAAAGEPGRAGGRPLGGGVREAHGHGRGGARSWP